MPRRDMQSFVTPMCRNLAESMGYELYDAELVKEGPGRYLRIYLDKEGGITLDDCERFHREVQPKLDQVDYDFLEVSSPGIDRPLKTEKDFAKNLHHEVEVRLYKSIDGTKVYNGTLTGFDESTVCVLTQSGERTFARQDAALIRPVIVFEDDEGETEA